MRVIIHADAKKELADAAEFYESRVPGLGLEFIELAIEATQAIGRQPKRYGIGVSGTRRFMMSRFPYAIPFLETTDAVWILAFAHTSRRPGYWKNRVPS